MRSTRLKSSYSVERSKARGPSNTAPREKSQSTSWSEQLRQRGYPIEREATALAVCPPPLPVRPPPMPPPPPPGWLVPISLIANLPPNPRMTGRMKYLRWHLTAIRLLQYVGFPYYLPLRRRRNIRRRMYHA